MLGSLHIRMGRVSDYNIRPKPKVWAGSPNVCRTFGRMLYAIVKKNVLYWWVHWATRKCCSK